MQAAAHIDHRRTLPVCRAVAWPFIAFWSFAVEPENERDVIIARIQAGSDSFFPVRDDNPENQRSETIGAISFGKISRCRPAPAGSM
jgi:hypothetical protein